MISRSILATRANVDSPLGRCDPRFLLVVFVLLTVFTFLVPRSAGLVVLIVYTAALAVLAGLRPSLLLVRLRPVAFFVVFILLLNAVLVDGRPLSAPFGFLSFEGFRNGVFLALRVVAIYLAATVFLTALSPEALARALSALVKPFSPTAARRIALYGFLSMGFVPLFTDELERIQTAQRFRGGALEGGIRQRFTSVRLVLVPLIVSAIHRSGQLALAVEIRGIRQSIDNILGLDPPAPRDYFFAGASLGIFLVATLA